MENEYSLHVKAELDTTGLNPSNPGNNSPGNALKNPQLNSFAREMQQFAATMKQSMSAMAEFRKALNSAAFQLRNLGKGSIQGGNLPTITHKSADFDISRLNSSIASLQNSINGMQTQLKQQHVPSIPAKSYPIVPHMQRSAFMPFPFDYENNARLAQYQHRRIGETGRTSKDFATIREILDQTYENFARYHNQYNNAGFNLDYRRAGRDYIHEHIREQMLQRNYLSQIPPSLHPDQFSPWNVTQNEQNSQRGNLNGQYKRMLTYFAGDMLFNRMAQAENPYVSIAGKTASTAMQGAFVGAGVGSAFPVIGTGIGAAVGGVVAGLTELIASMSDYSDKIRAEADKYAEAAVKYREAALRKAADIKQENRIQKIPKLSEAELKKRIEQSNKETEKLQKARTAEADIVNKKMEEAQKERDKKRTRTKTVIRDVYTDYGTIQIAFQEETPETDEEYKQAEKELAEKTKKITETLEKLDKSYQDSKKENDALNAELKKRQETLKKEKEDQEKRKKIQLDVEHARKENENRESIKDIAEGDVKQQIEDAKFRKEFVTQRINELLKIKKPTDEQINELTKWQQAETSEDNILKLLENTQKQFEAIDDQTERNNKYMFSESTSRADSNLIKTAFKNNDWQGLNDKAKSVRDQSAVAWKEMQVALKQISRDDLNVEEKTAWQNEFDKQKEMYVDYKNRSENFTDSAIAILQDAMSKVVAPDMNNVNSLAAQGFMTSASDDQERLKEQTDYLKRLADITEQIRILEQERDNSATYE